MHSDPKLTERLRDALADTPLVERVMFGGVAFFLRGNFCCGIWHDMLVLRLGVERAEEAMFRKHVVPMDITGTPMRGWVMIQPAGCRTRKQLGGWLDSAMSFVKTLPAKKSKTSRTCKTKK